AVGDQVFLILGRGGGGDELPVGGSAARGRLILDVPVAVDGAVPLRRVGGVDGDVQGVGIVDQVGGDARRLLGHDEAAESAGAGDRAAVADAGEGPGRQRAGELKTNRIDVPAGTVGGHVGDVAPVGNGHGAADVDDNRPAVEV